MRAGVVAVFIGAILAVAPAATAADGGFLDLPGIGALERLTDTEPSAGLSGTEATTRQITDPSGRAPAPDVSTKTPAAVTPAETEPIRGLPGGRHLPVLGVDAASANHGGDGMALALGLAVVVLFTRFLYRLNALGRSA